MRNISSKVDNVGDTLPAGDFNANLRSELQNVVETDAGFTLDPEGGGDTDLTMLGKAIAMYANAGWYYSDSGSVNSYVLSRVGSLRSVRTYIDGMIVVFLAGNANTGASTINVDTLGSKNLTLVGGIALTGGEISVGYVIARYRSTGDRFEIVYSGALTAALSRGYFAGLNLSNNSGDSDHDIDISVGEARSNDDTTSIYLKSALTKRIDASWSAGTNQGGLDTGSVANFTEYHVYLIHNPATNTTDVLFTITYGSPTMPSGYTKKRILGSIYTDGSANIRGFTQYGDEFLWNDSPLDIDVSNDTTTGTLRTLTVATGRKVIAIFNVVMYRGVDRTYTILSSPDQDDEAPSTTAAPLCTLDEGESFDVPARGFMRVRTNTSGQIRSRSDRSSTQLRIATLGWIDRRGKDD